MDMTPSASSGEHYQAGSVPPPLDLDLPDRRACLLAAAHAAAGWIREYRNTWTDAPVARPFRVPAAAKLAVAPDTSSSSSPVPAARSDAQSQPAAWVEIPIALPAEAAPVQAAPLERVEDREPAPVVPVPHGVALPETEPPLASDLDLASAEAFAPFLAEEREAARQAAAALQSDVPSLDARDGSSSSTLSEPSASAVVPGDSMPDVAIVPAELPPAGPGIGARVAQWARGGAAGVLSRWPAFATLAVLAVIGMSARSYWPRIMSARSGTAVLESVPDGSQVSIDGKSVGVTPLTTSLSPGDHSIEFVYKKTSRTMRVTITSGARTVERVDWTKKPNGRLQVHSDPEGAKVLVDGVERGVTPLTLDDLTVGAHAVVLQRADGSVERSVTVNATDITRVNEMIFPGWVTVFSPFNLNITEGSRPVRLDDRNQVMLPSGSHELRFENRALGYEETRRVDIKSGAVTTLSIVPPRSSLSVTSNQPGEVWLDGTSVGATPVNALPVELGTREIVVRTPDGDVRRFTITVTTKPVTLDASAGN